jgi:hypothetical protein
MGEDSMRISRRSICAADALRVLAAFLMLALVGPTFGQGQSAKSGAASSKSAGKASKTPRTPDGQPDIQGTWINFDSTPFERPDPASVSKPAGASSMPALPTVSLPFADQGPSTPKRTSMVVDPPDGRVPLTPWAEERRDYALGHVQDSWEYNTPWERCITRGIPGGIFPVVYDNAYQILQTPGYVVILYNMIHDTRIIPLDGRPHLPQSVRQWNGDPRGHWEGDTLVVETTNFNGKGMIASANLNGRLRSIPETEGASIVERFTRVDAKTINYEVTIKDPKAYSAPWTVAMPLSKDNSFRMYEYACHEGNQNYMEITLGAGRLQEKEGKSEQH